MKPSERRETIIDILYNRGKVQAKELSQEFGVGRKAIYRDMDYLCKFYHIERTRARGGGYRLVNPKINSRMVLSKEEMDFLRMLGERAELDEKERIKLNLIIKKLSNQARMIMDREESSE
ncbi:MAG: helix-turn-helix transcriptional regulator [Lentihominibacter sp.]